MSESKLQSLRKLLESEPTVVEPLLRLFIAAIKRQTRILLICIVVAFCIGLTYFLLTPSIWETSSSVQVAPATDITQPGMEVTIGSLLADQPQSMSGSPVIALALTSGHIRELSLLHGVANPIQFIRSKLTIRSRMETGGYDLIFTSTKPAEARELLDAIVSAYIQFQTPPTAPAVVTISEEPSVTARGNDVVVTRLKAAETSGQTVWPRVIPVFATSLLAGIIVGCMLALLRDGTRVHLQSVDDARLSARTAVLGRVSAMSEKLSSTELRGQCVLVQPEHPAAKAVQDVAAVLEKLLVRGIDKLVLVTGPGSRQGKSVLASNLAIAMAGAGQRVALIDGHPDRPTINGIYGIEDCLGLSTVLEGKLKLKDVLHVTALAGLEILPAGAPSHDWPALLNRPEFLAVLTELSERFDRVIIDAGPAATEECRMIAAFCDATILAVDERRCRRAELRAAGEDLRAVGAKVTGIVLNEVPPKRSGAVHNVSKLEFPSRRTSTAFSMADSSQTLLRATSGLQNAH